MNTNPPAARRRYRRSVLLAAAALVAVLALGAAEALVRLLVPAEAIFVAHGYYEADPELGIRLRPGFEGGWVRINALGMRDREHPRQKPPGARRILLLGDSFCFGVLRNAELHFANVLETRLAADFPGAEVLNSGTPTWGTVQQARYLEREGLALEPDLVLVALFLGNDIVDNAGPPLYTAVDGYAVPARWSDRASRLRVRAVSLLHRLALYRLLRYRLAAPDEPAKHALRKRYRRELVAQNRTADVLRLEQHQKQPGAGAAVLEAGWRNTLEALERIQHRTRERGIGLVLVLIPDDLQLNARWHEMLTADGLPLEAFDFAAMNARLREFARERALLCFDLSRALFEAYRDDRRPFGDPGTPIDGHFNALGERIAARQIELFLRRSGLLAGWTPAAAASPTSTPE